MTEEVWRQALSFLDTFRAGEHGGDITGLYSLAAQDQTGVLSRHKDKLLGPFSDRQVDMKIMYYELIKMLMDYDKKQQSEEEYFVTNTVHKIEGYQQLTNKLQRHLNKKFLTEIGDINQNQKQILTNIGDTNILLKLETLENNYQSLVQVNESLVERLESLEKSASKFSDEYINNIDARLKEFSGTNERLEKTIQMIGDNKTTLTRLIEKTDRHSDDIAFISRDFQDKLSDNSASQDALNQLSSEVRTEMEENKKSLEEKMEMLEEDQRVEREGTDQSLNKLLENVENIKNSLEDNLTEAKTARSDLSALTEDTRALERQMEETKEKMSGSAENLRNLESTVDSLESRHTETVTRMREVTVLTTEIEKYVKDMENKMITDSENAFEKIAKDMDQLQDSFKDLNNFKTDTESNSGVVWSKLGDVERNLAAAKDHIGDEVDGKLASQNDELSSRLHQVDLDNKELREKVVLLEDGHNSQVGKLSLMETLGDRLNTVEMARQQSDARARDEVEERVRETREAWEGSQAEMMKTVSGLQDQLTRTDESLAEVRAGLTVVVDDIAVNNTEIRTQLVQEIQTNIQEKISQVNILVQEYEIKSKDVGQMMKDDHRKEMASIEGQLNTIYQEYEKMEKSLEEYRSSYSNDWVELSKANKNNEDNIAKTDEKMNAIMEQANSLMINDARQDETLGKLESRVKSTEEKHQSLEEADVFLQEAGRQMTEKNSALETLMKTRQEAFSSGLEAVETSLGEVGNRVEALENISDQIQAKLAEEIEKLDKVDADFSSQFSDFQKETRTNLDNLRAMEDTLDSGLRDMLDTSSSFTNNMETVEEEIKRMRGSLVELDFKSEKAVVVETLTAQVDRMTEDKARQEENTAAELERLAGKIAELNEAASARLTDVDIYSQGVNTKISELENTVEDRLAQLADKTRSEVDSRLVIVEGRVTDNAEENKLIVQKFGNQQDSIEKIFTDISAHSSVLEEMLVLKETQMARLDGLGEDVEEKMGKLAGEVNNLEVKLTNNVTALEKQQSQDKDSLLTLTIEMYSVFDNYTLLIKSESEVAQHQPQLLGVYRMVDTYNDRPVYKQDQGENYVYYSSAGQCWLVGCLVGHRYSWLRNSSQAAPLCRYPSLLSSGWQVRTDTGDWEEAEQDSITFHNIKDVDKIKEIIRDIKSGQES